MCVVREATDFKMEDELKERARMIIFLSSWLKAFFQLNRPRFVNFQSARCRRKGPFLDALLEKAIASLGNAVDLVAPAGNLIGTVQYGDYVLALKELETAMKIIREFTGEG